ncbi:MAG TPA: divergent PAP2 family protein [Candidatus Omnitrophota bacterium]|nr:divergent PAP2 family protein [Candidatus Omnitrophota bacterium]
MSSPEHADYLGFAAVFFSWFVAQMIKVVRGILRYKRLNLRWIFDTGGMPSSHSSTTSSLATVVGLHYGWNTVPFLIALVFCIITMLDAAGVRRSVGRQARLLNRILDELKENGNGDILESHVRELLGHTPLEVFAGAVLGVLMTLLICA